MVIIERTNRNTKKCNTLNEHLMISTNFRFEDKSIFLQEVSF